MKHTFFTGLAFTVSLYADLSVGQIEHMISKIHDKRQGADLEILERTKSPFVRVEKGNNIKTFVIPAQSGELEISLHAIMNGRAYINDGWKSTGDRIMGYTLQHVGKSAVVLKNGNHIKKLFFHKKRDDFITIKGR